MGFPFGFLVGLVNLKRLRFQGWTASALAEKTASCIKSPKMLVPLVSRLRRRLAGFRSPRLARRHYAAGGKTSIRFRLVFPLVYSVITQKRMFGCRTVGTPPLSPTGKSEGKETA